MFKTNRTNSGQSQTYFSISFKFNSDKSNEIFFSRGNQTRTIFVFCYAPQPTLYSMFYTELDINICLLRKFYCKICFSDFNQPPSCWLPSTKDLTPTITRLRSIVDFCFINLSLYNVGNCIEFFCSSESKCMRHRALAGGVCSDTIIPSNISDPPSASPHPLPPAARLPTRPPPRPGAAQPTQNELARLRVGQEAAAANPVTTNQESVGPDGIPQFLQQTRKQRGDDNDV